MIRSFDSDYKLITSSDESENFNKETDKEQMLMGDVILFVNPGPKFQKNLA